MEQPLSGPQWTVVPSACCPGHTCPALSCLLLAQAAHSSAFPVCLRFLPPPPVQSVNHIFFLAQRILGSDPVCAIEYRNLKYDTQTCRKSEALNQYVCFYSLRIKACLSWPRHQSLSYPVAPGDKVIRNCVLFDSQTVLISFFLCEPKL